MAWLRSNAVICLVLSKKHTVKYQTVRKDGSEVTIPLFIILIKV
jgi:hypothetical protein